MQQCDQEASDDPIGKEMTFLFYGDNDDDNDDKLTMMMMKTMKNQP